jgi:hypothetical protein
MEVGYVILAITVKAVSTLLRRVQISLVSNNIIMCKKILLLRTVMAEFSAVIELLRGFVVVKA